jgi:hypothetical protein
MAWVRVIKGVQVTLSLRNADFDKVLSSDSFQALNNLSKECRITEHSMNVDRDKMFVIVGVCLSDEVDAESLDSVALNTTNKDINQRQNQAVEFMVAELKSMRPSVKEGVCIVRVD